MDVKKSDNLHDDPIDGFFREGLAEPGTAVPMGDWPALEKRVRAHFEKKKKRRFIIFFFFLLLMAGGIYIFSSVLPGSSQGEITKQYTDEVSNNDHKSSQNQTDAIQLTSPANNTVINHAVREQPLTQNDAVEPKAINELNRSVTTGLITKTVVMSRTSAAKRNHPGEKGKKATPSNNLNAVFEPVRENTVQSIPVTTPESVAFQKNETVAITQVKEETKSKASSSPAEVEEAEIEERFGWVDIHAGYNRTSPLLSGNTSQPGYFSKRRSEETGSFRPAYGISFRFKVYSIVGSIGADVISYGENVDYSKTAIKRFQSVSGGQLVYRDSSITNESFVAERENRLTYVEFPVYVGYEFPTQGKFGASLMGGLSMGLLVGTRNTYIDTALTGAYTFESRKKESFRQQTFSIGILPSFEYRMTSFSELYIAFPVRYHLTSVLHPQFGVKQRYLSPGVQFGYMINLKGQ